MSGTTLSMSLGWATSGTRSALQLFHTWSNRWTWVRHCAQRARPWAGLEELRCQSTTECTTMHPRCLAGQHPKIRWALMISVATMSEIPPPLRSLVVLSPTVRREAGAVVHVSDRRSLARTARQGALSSPFPPVLYGSSSIGGTLLFGEVPQPRSSSMGDRVRIKPPLPNTGKGPELFEAVRIPPDEHKHVTELLQEVHRVAVEDNVSVLIDARDLVRHPPPPRGLAELCYEIDDVEVHLSRDQCLGERDALSSLGPKLDGYALDLLARRESLMTDYIYRGEPGTPLMVATVRFTPKYIIRRSWSSAEVTRVAALRRYPKPHKFELLLPFAPKGDPPCKGLDEPQRLRRTWARPGTIKPAPPFKAKPRPGTIQHLRRPQGDTGDTRDRYNLAWPSRRLWITLPNKTAVQQELELSADLEAAFDPLSMELTVSILALHMSVGGQLESRVRHGAVLGYFVDRVRIQAVASDPALLVLQSVSPQAAAADNPVHLERECGKERQREIGITGAASPSVSFTAGRVTSGRQLEEADTTRRPWVWTSAKTQDGTTAVWTWAMSAWEGGLVYCKTDALPAGQPMPRLDRRLAGAASVSGTAERVAVRWSVHPRRARPTQAPASSSGGWLSTVRLALRMDVAVSAVVEREWSRYQVNPFAQRPELRSWPAREGDPEAAVSFDLELRLPSRRT